MGCTASAQFAVGSDGRTTETYSGCFGRVREVDLFERAGVRIVVIYEAEGSTVIELAGLEDVTQRYDLWVSASYSVRARQYRTERQSELWCGV